MKDDLWPVLVFFFGLFALGMGFFSAILTYLLWAGK